MTTLYPLSACDFTLPAIIPTSGQVPSRKGRPSSFRYFLLWGECHVHEPQQLILYLHFLILMNYCSGNHQLPYIILR